MNDFEKPANTVSPLRRRAEEAIQHRLAEFAQGSEVISPEKSKRVLAELQVHQLELEMQNEELRRALAELDQTKSRYFDLYDLAPIGYCTISESGLIVQANLTTSKMLGMPRREILHQPIYRFIDHQDSDVYYLHRIQLRKSEQAQSFELRMISAGGTTFWANLDVVAAQGDDGSPANWVVISDISARKKIELALAAALDAAEVANRAKTLFISNMSHEFRTPMNVILGFCEILQIKLIDPTQKGWIVKIKQAANELLAILNNILDFSQLEAGKLELHRRTSNFTDFMEQVVARYRQLAKAKGLFFQVTLDAGIPETLSADHDRLQLVLDSLLDNALKFTASGSVTVHASAARIKPNWVMLKVEIQDTGIGVEDEKQKIIFDRFVQGDSSSTRAFGGTGIGLSISQKLVRLMGGEIGMTSRSGEGSTFWFTVPLQRVPTGEGIARPMTGSQ